MNDQTRTDTRTDDLPSEPPVGLDPAGTPVRSTTAEARVDDHGKALGVYVLYLAGLVTGGTTTLIGLVLAYIAKGDADAVATSHHQNAIGVFWKGILYSVACLILTITVIGAISWLVLGVWFIVRCVKGLVALNNNEAYPNPKSWGF